MLDQKPPSPEDLPEKSSIFAIAPDDVLSATVVAGIAYWRRLKGERRMPARQALSPRDMTAFLRNILLLRVIDDGADYEFRLAGDAHVEAFDGSIAGTRLTQFEARAPTEGKLVRGTYEHVRSTCEPLCVRGWIGNGDTEHLRFAFHESAYLPLGDNDDKVDHILLVSCYLKRLSGMRSTSKPDIVRAIT